jgi:ATP-dependent Clp protease ATP-binding subunit ClpA
MDINRFTQEAVVRARPLKRVIQREVQDPLALLRGEFEGDTVRVDVRDGKVVSEGSGPGLVDAVAEATTAADAT